MTTMNTEPSIEPLREWWLSKPHLKDERVEQALAAYDAKCLELTRVGVKLSHLENAMEARMGEISSLKQRVERLEGCLRECTEAMKGSDDFQLSLALTHAQNVLGNTTTEEKQ